jgi:type I restriction enzyme R subunit
LFDVYFADKPAEIREQIKKTYGKELAVLEAPKRIEMICIDILNHYKTKIQPNGFKAQIVTASRRAAVLYKQALDELNAPESAVIISGAHNDEPFFHPYTDEVKQKDQIDRFKKSMEKDQLSILIVKDMLITGFDAPVEQVMYLDRKLMDHTLLQAIARVNRTAEGKSCGFIVDYYGLSDYLNEALKVFTTTDVAGALTPLKEELPKLESRHAKVMQYFKHIPKKNMDGCIRELEDEEHRQDFLSDLKKFLQSMETIMPDKTAARFIPDMKWLGEIAARARNRYRDPMLEVKGCGEKVRKLINEHVYSAGIDLKIRPIDLLAPNFKEHLNSIKSKRSQASEIEHAIKHHITIRLAEDPEYYASLSERLKNIIEKLHDNWGQLVLALTEIRDTIEERRGSEAESLGLSTTEFAFYNVIVKETVQPNSLSELSYDKKQEYSNLAAQIVDLLEEATLIVDFYSPVKEHEQKRVRRDMKRILQEASFADLIATNKQIIDRFMDLGKVHFSGNQQ